MVDEDFLPWLLKGHFSARSATARSKFGESKITQRFDPILEEMYVAVLRGIWIRRSLTLTPYLLDDHRRRHSLIKSCFRSYTVPCLSAIIPRLCLSIFTFSQPFLINTTLDFVGQDNPKADYGKGLIAAWTLVYLGMAFRNSVYQYYNLRFTTSIRGGLIALIYEESIHTREVDTGDITAVSLMGTDVERIFGASSVIQALWGSSIDIAVASCLLGLQLSVACLAPICLVLGELNL
jgi:ATP-binding cassette subfamily C (CFTR/MRP) protein 1